MGYWRSAGILATCALAMTLLSGCIGYTLVKGGERTSLSPSMSVVPPQDWNRMSEDKVDYWTLDGAVLQRIIFVKGAEDGDMLWRAGADKEKAPRFRKGMNALEVAELVQATMANQKLQNIKFAELKPAPFAGHQGFAFDFTATLQKGLDIKGTARGAVVKDRLYLALYRGAALHFYDRSRGDFDKILTSLKIGQDG